MSEKTHKIGITHGDLNSINYEVILKSLCDNKIMEICLPIVYGLSKVSSYYRKSIDVQNFSYFYIKNAEQTSPKKPNMINIYEEDVKIEPGISTRAAGQMAERALYMAGRDLKNKLIDAIVTAPFNKENIRSEKFIFQDHVDFFEHYFGGAERKALKMIVSEDFRIGFVTHNETVEETAALLQKDMIYKKLEILNRSLRQDFGVSNPTIAVLAFNPPKDKDVFDSEEEQKHIIPAVELAFQNHINAFGPFYGDELFEKGSCRNFDAVLAMNFDQGNTLFHKFSSNGVFFTAGLPIVHTAPNMDNIYDLVNKNKSDGQAMRNAIYLALDILRNREK